MKQLFLPLTFLSLVLVSCQSDGPIELITVSVAVDDQKITAQYLDSSQVNYQKAIDSIADQIYQQFSHKVPTSFVAQVNQADSLIGPADITFQKVWAKHFTVQNQSKGRVDPTQPNQVLAVQKLPNLFTNPDSNVVDSMFAFARYENIYLLFQEETEDRAEGMYMKKEDPRVTLNFDLLLRGYMVDEITSFLRSKQITQYLVSMNGVFSAGGNAPGKEGWEVVLRNPMPAIEEQDSLATFLLKNEYLATSTHYYATYDRSTGKITRINPQTGYPEETNLICATVISPGCLGSDLWSTALLQMGMEEGIKYANYDANLQVCFAYLDEQQKIQTNCTRRLELRIKELR